MTAYYNEIDEYAADWLENLIAGGHIAPGAVDRRSIEDVQPDDLRGFTQCHFFAGVGVWSYALRLAGWPDDRPLWTGSCPCQPFSGAGKGLGVNDPRHLWPAWLRLIRQCRPTEILGEQVAGGDGLVWADIVQPDMEGEDYACGFLDTCSAGHRAPHIRQRLRFAAYDLRSSAGWVADAVVAGLEGHGRDGDGGREPGRVGAIETGPASAPGQSGGLADAGGPGLIPGSQPRVHRNQEGPRPRDGQPERLGNSGGLADAGGQRRQQDAGGASGDEAADGSAGRIEREPDGDHQLVGHGADRRPGPLDGFWRDADWLLCRDGKWRPVEPGTFPLATGTPARVGRLRAYGNAIDAQATVAFIKAYLEVTGRS